MSAASSIEPEWELPENAEFLFEDWRYKGGKGGRGGTKSWSFGRGALIKGYQAPKRILCAREIQKSIKDSVHQLLEDQIGYLGLHGFYKVQKQEIIGLNGTSIIFTGLSNLTVSQIKSFEGIDICWVEEAATVSKRSWDILIPTIRKEGSEIWFTFNPELDTDETWLRFVEDPPLDCHVEEMSFDTNPWFPEVLEKERQELLRRIERGTAEQEEYDNIWLGKPKSAVDGAIYAKQTLMVREQNRLTHVPHDPVLFTHLVWDLGYSDNMVIGFVQRAGSSIRFIDYIEDSHRTYDSYVAEIRQKAEKEGYRIALDGRTGGKAWLPHDGYASDPKTGKTAAKIIDDLGLECPQDEGVPNIGIKNRIEAGRQMFARCVFDKEKCTPLFNRLRRYARKINPEGHAVTIKKDGNDHAGDMFTYVAVVEGKLDNERQKRKIAYDYRISPP